MTKPEALTPEALTPEALTPEALTKNRALANWTDHVGSSIACSEQQMLQRTARYSTISTSPRAFVDPYLPGHERKLHSVIGNGVTGDPNFKPAIAAAEHFHVDYITAAEGRGAALHAHDTEEVFVAMRGRWQVYWLDADGKAAETTRRHIVLDKSDVVSLPPEGMRGCASLDGERGLLLSILGARLPGGSSGTAVSPPKHKRSGLDLMTRVMKSSSASRLYRECV